MTKQEAIQAMKAGIKVCHSSFMPHEWIVMAGVCTIETEEGYQSNANDFWFFRNNENWDNGWAIWDDTTINKEQDEDHFECCMVCDLPDACRDYGCAVKQGLKDNTEIR